MSGVESSSGLFAPSWRARQSKYIGESNDGGFASGLGEDDPTRRRMTKTGSIVADGLFGGADIKGESGGKELAGGLFDDSDDEKELK
jgi:hypothetical protein